MYLEDEFHYAWGKRCIEVVGGGMEKNEKPLQAAQRELREELGIEAEEWIPLGEVNSFTTIVYCPVQLFLARKLRFTKRHLDSTEVITPVRVPFAKAVQMVRENAISHGPSSVLILKAEDYLRRQKR